MRQHADFEPYLYSSPDHTSTFKKLLGSSGHVSFRYHDDKPSVVIPEKKFRITHSIGDILSGCDILINTLPINAHIPIFDGLYKELSVDNRQMKYINLSGGFVIFDHIQKQQKRKLLSIASAHTLPFASRASEGSISILNRRKKTLISFSDDDLLPDIRKLEELMSTPLINDGNHLHCAIDRSSYVMHPLITMMNYAKIERNEPFHFYRDGLTESIEKLLVETGYERKSLCDKLGFTDFISPEQRVKQFKENYMEDFKNVLPPTSSQHRFFTEDIPFGLVFMCTLGTTLGIPMPLSEAIVNITSSLCKNNFWNSPLNLSNNDSLAKTVLSFQENNEK